MKAILCQQFGPVDELQFVDVDDPTPGPSQLLVKVRAIGVNYTDVVLVQGLYQARPPFPFIPGCEFCGEVEAVGRNIKDCQPGDRIIGLNPDFGAFAEKVAIDAENVIKVPGNMPDADAASILCAHGTAHHALKQRGQLQTGETLLVLGAAGGTGVAAVQIGKAMGASVIAACSSDDKLAVAKRNGADVLVNYDKEDLKETIKSSTGGRGIDVVFDPVGGEAFDTCTRSMARNGRLLVIGFVSGNIPQFPVNLALVKEFAVIGVFWGSFVRHEPNVFIENMKELFDWYEKGKVWPDLGKEYSLAEATTALDDLVQRRSTGKLVLIP